MFDVYWYVLHSSLSLHMQSVTDAAAIQEPPSCEFPLSVLVVFGFTLCTHLIYYDIDLSG